MNLQKALVLSLVLGAGTTALAGQTGFQGATLTDNEYIIGGTTAAADDPVVSSTVLVMGKSSDPKGSQYICSGSIIAQDMIVTAAHCVDAQPENIRVIFLRDLNNVADRKTALSKGLVLPITGYIANPDYESEPFTFDSNGQMVPPPDADQHDIAVIRLKGNLPAGYKPATLLSAAESNALKAGDDVLLAGYGIDNASAQTGQGTLRETQVKVGSPLGETEITVDQRHGTGACHGDSGGPAFVRVNGQLMLWGVADREYPANTPDDCASYLVYTRFQSYAGWITEAETQLRTEATQQMDAQSHPAF